MAHFTNLLSNQFASPEKKVVWSMSISHMFIELYFLMHLTLIPTFINEFNLTLLEASLIVTVPTFVALIINLLSGFLVDRMGTKPLLVLGMLLEASGGIFVAESWSVEPLVLGITLIVVASPFYHNSGLSAISKVVEVKGLSKMMGIHNALGSIGTSLGLFTLPVILVFGGWRLAYAVWVIPILLWTVFLLRARFDIDHKIDDEPYTKIPLKSVLSKAFVFFIVALAIYYAGSNVITTFISSYMVFVKGISQAFTSLIFAIGSLMGIISSVISGYLGSRIGDRSTLALVMTGAAIFTLIIPLAPSTITLAIFFLCFNLFTHSIWPPLTSIVASLSSTSRRGLAYSIMRTTSDIVNVVNQPLAAGLFEFTSLWMMFPLSFALTSIGVIVLKISSSYVK